MLKTIVTTLLMMTTDAFANHRGGGGVLPPALFGTRWKIHDRMWSVSKNAELDMIPIPIDLAKELTFELHKQNHSLDIHIGGALVRMRWSFVHPDDDSIVSSPLIKKHLSDLDNVHILKFSNMEYCRPPHPKHWWALSSRMSMMQTFQRHPLYLFVHKHSSDHNDVCRNEGFHFPWLWHHHHGILHLLPVVHRHEEK